MSFAYTNRKGQTYQLQSATTKTGKTRYYMGRKVTGTTEECLPDGYEIWENPETAQVYVRRARPSVIIEPERRLLEEAIRTQGEIEHFIIDVDDRHLVVYVLDRDPNNVAVIMGMALGVGPEALDSVRDDIVARGNYQKMMRFTLVDEDERLFAAERWCFRGSIDDWIPLRGGMSLEDLAAAYLPHLGQQSFFDLMM